MYNFDLLMRSQVATKVVISQAALRLRLELPCHSSAYMQRTQKLLQCSMQRRDLRRSAKTQPKERTKLGSAGAACFSIAVCIHQSQCLGWLAAWVVASTVLGFFHPNFFGCCFFLNLELVLPRILDFSFMASFSPVHVFVRCPELLLPCYWDAPFGILDSSFPPSCPGDLDCSLLVAVATVRPSKADCITVDKERPTNGFSGLKNAAASAPSLCILDATASDLLEASVHVVPALFVSRKSPGFQLYRRGSRNL